MRCFGTNRNDELCDMCKHVNHPYHNDCKNAYMNKASHNIKLKLIKSKCKNLTQCWDEYNSFDACDLKGNGNGRHADNCGVTLECEQYCKGKD